MHQVDQLQMLIFYLGYKLKRKVHHSSLLVATSFLGSVCQNVSSLTWVNGGRASC